MPQAHTHTSHAKQPSHTLCACHPCPLSPSPFSIHQVRTLKVEEPTDSFFNFFDPPNVPDEDEEMDEEEVDQLHETLESDYELGCVIKDKVISKPRKKARENAHIASSTPPPLAPPTPHTRSSSLSLTQLCAQIIPRAVAWYTGMAVVPEDEYDDDDDEDYDDEDDEDDDDDDEDDDEEEEEESDDEPPPAKGGKGGKGGMGRGGGGRGGGGRGGGGGQPMMGGPGPAGGKGGEGGENPECKQQ